MNYKKLFEISFSNVVPPVDSRTIMSKVLERTEKMDNRIIKKKGIRKPFVAVIAAAATLALGVTGAAALGLISFNEAFGGEIKTEIEDPYVLMARTENVETYSSDEDYDVNLLGVTGGNDCAIISIEISRKDGKPVTDFFLSKTDDSDMSCIISAECNWDNPNTDKRQISRQWINEKGNIMVNIEFSAEFDYIDDTTSLAGKTITINGDSFYPADDFWDYFEVNELKYVYYPSSEQIVTKDGTPVEDFPEINSLPLEWGLSFDYYPSEKSTVKLYMKDEDKNSLVTFKKKQMNYIDPNYPEIIEYSLEVMDIEIGSTSGFIDIIEYKDSKPEFPAHCFPNNEICLITKNGEKIMMNSNGGVASANAEHQISREKMIYSSESAEYGGYSRLAIDVDEIAAISINGQIFELVPDSNITE